MGSPSRPFVNFQNMSGPTTVKHRLCVVRSHRLIRPPMKRRNSRNFGSRSDLFYLRPCVRLFLFAHSSIIIRERITGVELGLCRIGDSGLPDCDICASPVWTLYFIPWPPLSLCLYLYMDPPSIAIVLDSGDINGWAEPCPTTPSLCASSPNLLCQPLLSDVIETNHQMIASQWTGLMAL